MADYYQNLAKDTAILYSRLRKNPSSLTNEHTAAIRKIKANIKQLPCIHLANPNWFKIVEIDASNIGYGGILKQINPEIKEFLHDSPLKSEIQPTIIIPPLKRKCLSIIVFINFKMIY